MRRELITVFVAVSTMIVIAFLFPLALSARSTASDRAMDEARAATARLVPVIAAGSVAAVEADIDLIEGEGRLVLTVVMPDGTELGSPTVGANRGRLAVVRDEAVSISTDVDGGRELITAVALPDGGRAAVLVFVPDRELHRGVWPAWLILGALGAGLVLITVALADRMAQRVIRPAQRLGEAATALGRGDFEVKVEPDGPTELAATATAFNSLVQRVQTMVDDERAMVGELAHRLRTPMTRLRIDLDQVTDPDLASRLQADVDALTVEVNDLIVRARQNAEPPRPVDLTALTRGRFEFWSALAAEENRACAFSGDQQALVAVDPDDFEAAIDVLIDNVFSHTNRGTRFEVAVLTEPGSWLAPEPHPVVRVRVDDAGPGFTPDDEHPDDEHPHNRAEHEPGDGTPVEGSTGLGLGIVRRLMVNQGGYLGIGESPLGGTRVECVFGRSEPLDLDQGVVKGG